MQILGRAVRKANRVYKNMQVFKMTNMKNKYLQILGQGIKRARTNSPPLKFVCCTTGVYIRILPCFGWSKCSDFINIFLLFHFFVEKTNQKEAKSMHSRLQKANLFKLFAFQQYMINKNQELVFLS